MGQIFTNLAALVRMVSWITGEEILVNDNVQSNVRGYLLLQYLIDIYPPLITQNRTTNQRSNPGSHLLGNTATPTVTNLFLLLWPLVIDLEEPAVREEEIKETMARGRRMRFSVILCPQEHKSGN